MSTPQSPSVAEMHWPHTHELTDAIHIRSEAETSRFLRVHAEETWFRDAGQHRRAQPSVWMLTGSLYDRSLCADGSAAALFAWRWAGSIAEAPERLHGQGDAARSSIRHSARGRRARTGLVLRLGLG